MKNRHQECYARSCREIEELRRRCYEEQNEVTQQMLNEHSMQHDEESRTASLLRDQIRTLQERLEFIEDSNIFQGPDSPSSFGSAHVPHQALITSSSFSLAANQECSKIHGRIGVSPEAFFDCQPARRAPEELHNDSKNLAISLQILRTEGIEKSGSEEPLQSIP